MRTKIKEAAASIWFARIVSLFTDQDDDEGSAHVRWFDHGGDTILNETAGPKELFLLGRCNDIKLVSRDWSNLNNSFTEFKYRPPSLAR
jgi:hypothetical protein